MNEWDEWCEWFETMFDMLWMIWMQNTRSITKLCLQSISLFTFFRFHLSHVCVDLPIWHSYLTRLSRVSRVSRGCRHGPFCGSCQQRLARKAGAGSVAASDVAQSMCGSMWGSSLLCLPRLDRFVVWKMWRGGLLAHFLAKVWSTLQKSSKSWCSKSSADVVFFHTLFDSVLKEVSPDVQCHVVTFM